MYSKSFIRVFMVLAFGLSLLVFGGCSDLTLDERIEQGVEELVGRAFYIYKEFGLVFDSETRNLYYNDEEVAFFEDRRGALTRTMHGDRNASGLHIYANVMRTEA